MNSILLTVLLDIAFAAAPVVAVVYMYRHSDMLRAADALRPVAVLTVGLLIWAAYHFLDAVVLLFGPFFVENAQLPAITDFIQNTLRWFTDAVATIFLAIGFIWLFSRLIDILRGLQSSHSALAHEIDARSEREAELKARAKSERAQSQSRSEFILGLSHELRTPLNGILGLSGLLSNTELDVSQRKLLVTIERSAQAMLARVSDVLDLARLENDKVQLRSVAFRPDELAQTVVGLFEPLAAEKGLELGLEVGDGAELSVLGDPGRVRQILNNLLSNALKFTPAGSIILVVDQTTDKGDKRWIQFQVRDTGVGMDDEVLERVTGRTGSGAGGDSGLGLSICRRLSRLMDGDLTIQSVPGEGTTVTARIRVQDEPDPVD
ncbi:HAMP domain-containing sensor histidine kinase [uncultured Maricaulis sp.]|uniref:sensor histidine kinase n=1 Tax=uncultured Maricaulis sp. TaxID=174710 RepID=UPI00260171B9|nr:HAMP domain-containing sensor histidine kinase [uncultured Maricaulis sp.]